MLSFSVQWRDVARYGFIVSLGFTGAVLISYWIEPLAWASDFPPEVQARLGSIPQYAMYVGWTVFVSIMVLLIGGPAVLGHRLRRHNNAQSSFFSVFSHAFLVLLIVNAWDLLVVDVFIFDILSPEFMMMTEAKEWLLEYVTLAFHLKAFFIGIPIMALVALLSTGVSFASSRRRPMVAA